MDKLHWSNVLPAVSDDFFYRQPNYIPPPVVLPENYECELYNFPWDKLASDEEEKIITFVNTHNQVGKYNFSRIDGETINRFQKTKACMAVLKDKSVIIGTMISMGFRCEYKISQCSPPEEQRDKSREIHTSYTTFLCVHKNYRENGLAMILIQSIMRNGQKFNIHSGYYLSHIPHQEITARSAIRSWYRPVDHIRALKLGYKLPKLSQKGENKRRYRIMYHIPAIDVPPRLVNPGIDEWKKAISFFNNNSLSLTPTEEEFRFHCSFFNIYLFDKGILMVLPLSVMISSTHQIAHNLYVAYMSSNLLPEALYIAKETHCDLLTGFYVGEITEERIEKIKGNTTIAPTYLEFYNTSEQVRIPPESFMLPLF